MSATMPTDVTIDTPVILDGLTPDAGLRLRRWNENEFRQMLSTHVFGPEARAELVDGEVCLPQGTGPRPFTRDEYYRLGEQGIIKPDERTELIFGRVVQRMSPMGGPHSMALRKTIIALEQVFRDGYDVRSQMPIHMSTGLEPEPDVLVVPGTPEDYPDAPLPSDALLLVEVSDTTLPYDRGLKASVFAHDGIADYWLVNLRMRILEVRRQPEDGHYTSLDVYHEHETVAPLAATNAPIRVADLLPLVR